jgi:hypothetical protein
MGFLSTILAVLRWTAGPVVVTPEPALIYRAQVDVEPGHRARLDTNVERRARVDVRTTHRMQVEPK